jgi:4-aminobutyrate aminotransferase / (S)-3-amino-2-methylpropionate transaminase / 5-aminovalerate transaminase
MDDFVEDQLYKLEESTRNLVDPRKLAAIIIEPIQGEGGFNCVPQKYFEGLRAFCDKHGILLIADEIQSGFARTGNWASWQNYNVTPDISTYAKSLGSGMPIAAVLGKAEIMDSAVSGSIGGGTYIGSPVCCAAALATIQLMKDLDLNKRGKEVGAIIMKRFEQMKSSHKEIGDVRGMGSMLAMEFVKNSHPRQPDGELCKEIIEGCAEKGLVIISAGIHKNIIRILSPLVISDDLLNKGLDILENEIKKAVRK